MQLLEKETISQANPSNCSAQMVEVVPIIMRGIRREMRRRTMPGLSHVQYRTLRYLKAHPHSSLSDVADFLGLTLPSTSKLVQNLVTQKVVARRRSGDRRRVCLSLTTKGQSAFAAAQLETQNQLAEILSSLTPEELSTISEALHILSAAFSGVTTGVNLP